MNSTSVDRTIAFRTAMLAFPMEGELILSPHYTVRVSAKDAKGVDLSIDGGSWLACHGDGQSWAYDWGGYSAGNHVICARITYPDGKRETLRPRALRVVFAKQYADELRDVTKTAIGQALAFLKEQRVAFVQLWFTEIGGKGWRISLPVEHIQESSFTAGVTLDGPSTGVCFPSYINLLPDPKAVFLDPMATVPTAAIMCDLLEPTDIAPIALGVRRTLRNAVASLEQIKAGLTATMGAEAEFFLLEPNGEPSPETDVWVFLCDLARTLQEAGIKSEGFRFGPALGQGRVQMRWADPVRTADHLMLYRWFAKSLARRRGKRLTFESKSPSGEGAASMPVHHTLWQGAENAFHDPNGWQYTSELCRHYIGGLIKHARAISAFVGTTTGSYPLRAGSQASVIKPYLSATKADAFCRVPERMLYAAGRRVKTRAGDAGANPYLALGAMLLAGIDGVRNRIEPAMDSNGSMPQSLDEALHSLKEDKEFLKRGGFTDGLIEAWSDERRKTPGRAALEA